MQSIGSRQDLDAAQAHYHAMQATYDTTLNQTRNLVREIERTRAVVDLQRKKLRDNAAYFLFVIEGLGQICDGVRHRREDAASLGRRRGTHRSQSANVSGSARREGLPAAEVRRQ